MPAESLRGSETILVVDDDSGVRKPMMRTLEACGYLVLEAHSGEHALTILDEHHGPVQLLVTDVVMPDMDGAKLAVMLREWYPRLSVLLLSGHGERAFDVVGIKRPAGTHFLAKPFKPSDLGRVVREILDAEWGIDAKRMGQDDTERIQAGDAQRRTEKRIGARRRAYRIAAECEFLQNELLRSEHRNWADAFGRVLMSARRLIALTPAGGEDMFDSELRPLPLLKEVQDEILAAVTALVSAVGASRDSPAARGVHLIRELAQQLFYGSEETSSPLVRPPQTPVPRTTPFRSTVLAIDDDADIIRLLKRSLESWGLNVLTARDGREGLAILSGRQDSIDLVLTDIEMPHLDGVSLLSAIKANPDTQRIPVIVLSSTDDMASVSRCIELGAEDHISKPFAAQLLSARVKASLERKRLHDAETDGLRRIQRLIDAAEAVERNAYSPDALDGLKGTSDGLGQLARVFDRMVTGLRTREERLQQRLKRLRIEVSGSHKSVPAAAPLAGDSPFALGDAIADRFEIVGQLGRGGMGAVYLAHDRELNEEVALKIIRRELVAENPQILERLRSEIRLARKISHPNVVRAHDIGEWHGRYFITMERVSGVTVADLLDQRGRLTVDSTLAIGTQLCEALAVAHDNEIIHRDIKPSNLFIDERGTLKVMDFGIARRLTTTSGALTGDGFLVGTPHYMAPELLMGAKPGVSTDLFAVGVVLYECITGRPPFEGETAIQLYAAVLDDVGPRIGELVPDVPSQLEALIHQQLRFDPASRAPSARDLSQRLSELDHAQ